MMCQYLAYSWLCVYYTALYFVVLLKYPVSTRRRNVFILYIVIIVFYLKVKLIINGNKQELMIIQELFEGPEGDYCNARNTIKCLLR